MNFSDYENAIMILDQSFWQQECFGITYYCSNVYEFLKEKNIKIVTTISSAEELAYQVYYPNLFSGYFNIEHFTDSTISNSQDFVLSSYNGVLTKFEFDRKGYPIEIFNTNLLDSSSLLSLWDSAGNFSKLENVDKEITYLARYFQKLRERFFVATNDQKLVNQLEIEGVKYLRPITLLYWMQKENYVTKQKVVWQYKKRKEHNKRWVPKGYSFRDLISKMFKNGK